MGGECGTHGGGKCEYRISVGGKIPRKKPLVRLIYRREYIINLDF